MSYPIPPGRDHIAPHEAIASAPAGGLPQYNVPAGQRQAPTSQRYQEQLRNAPARVGGNLLDGVSEHVLPNTGERSWQLIGMYTFGEFMGSMIFGMIGFTAACSTNGSLGPTAMAFGFGFAATCIMFSSVCLCHFNPVISFASVVLDAHTSLLEACFYSVAQLVGFIAAAGFALVLFEGDQEHYMANVVAPATVPPATPAYTEGQAFLVEFLFTVVWVCMVARLTMHRKPKIESVKTNKLTKNAIALGFGLTALHFASMRITGTSLNIARSLGPSIVLVDFWNPFVATSYWIFPVSAITAGLLGTLLSFGMQWARSYSKSDEEPDFTESRMSKLY